MSPPPVKNRRPVSILDFYPYLPVRFVPLLEDLPEDAEQVCVLLPFKSGAGRPGEADLQIGLIGAADGRDVPVEWSPDTFGHAATVPTYLAQGGIRFVYMHRPGAHGRARRPRRAWS